MANPIPNIRSKNENNNNYRYHGMRNNNQLDSESHPVEPLVGDESIAKGGSLADEIYNFFSSGNENKNATGINALFGEGLQGFDPLIAIKDCSCKTPLLDALKKQTEATTREKEEHEITRSKRIMSEREVNNLRNQITACLDSEAQLKTENNDLRATVEQLQSRVQDTKETARNSETLIERIRSELVVKHGELAREVQRAKKAEADVEILEQQVESLQRQVSEYDEERIALERGRTALQSRFVEGVTKFKTLKVEAEMEKDELAQLVTAMQEQVKVMSLKKTTAEQESRAFREKLETLSTNSSKDKQQIRTLEEALTKEEADHNSQVVKLKSEIGRLEELVDSVKLKAQMDVSGLDRSKGQCNNLLLRATKEIAHLDRTTEDLKIHVDALNKECQDLKNAKKESDDEFKFKEEIWKDEKEKLLYEIKRLGVIGSEMDEARNEAEVKVLHLEEELSNSERLLQINENELEQLEEAMEKRTESLNNALKGATEKLHQEMEGLKANLRVKSTELQALKSSINAAGGEVSLMPLDREDYQKVLRESEELKRENEELVESLRHSSVREDRLQSELDRIIAEDEVEEVMGDGTVVVRSKRESEAEAQEGRQKRLTTDLNELRANYDELQVALSGAQAETKKLTNILRETLVARPIDLNAEMYQKRMESRGAPARTSAMDEEVNDRENRAEKIGGEHGGDDDNPMAKPPMAGGGNVVTSRNSLESLEKIARVARNYQLRKGVGEAMQRHGIDNAELSELAHTYENEHMDFNKIFDDIVHKAHKYRVERVALANQLKEMKVENHFLKLELKMYKELEVKMKELGNLDNEIVKNAKVDVAEEMAQHRPTLDLEPEIAAAVTKSDYPKSSIVQMRTMFKEQTHILDIADQFHSLDDLLRALREDISTETRALKREIESMIRLVDQMKEDGGEKNVHAGGAGGWRLEAGGWKLEASRTRDGEDEESGNRNENQEIVSSAYKSGGGVAGGSINVVASRGGSAAGGASRGGPRQASGRESTSRRSKGASLKDGGSVGVGRSGEASRHTSGRELTRSSGRASPTKASESSSGFRESLMQDATAPSNGANKDATENQETYRNADGESLLSSALELTEDEAEDLKNPTGSVTEGDEFYGSNGNAEKSTKGSHRSTRVDFKLPHDSNKNNISGFAEANWRTGGEPLGNAKTKQILKEASLERVERDEGKITLNPGSREDGGKTKRLIRTRVDSFEDEGADRDVGMRKKRKDNWRSNIHRKALDSMDDNVASEGERSGRGGFSQDQSREVDEQGQEWLTDDAGRRWVVDESGRKWRLGLDGQHYMIDEEGVRWTVEEVEGRRRRWRRNRRGEYVFAEEDGVEWIVDNVQSKGAAGRRGGVFERRRDGEGNEILRDEDRREWILDDVGRGWGENKKGQTLMLDEVGRTWKFDKDGKGTGKFGYRRDALGQKWMIDQHGAVWLVANDRRGWRVDSDSNVLTVETGRGGGAEARWLIERSSGIQWLVDENRHRLRAASKRETIAVPPEVKLALNAEIESDAVSVGGRSAGSERRRKRKEEEDDERSITSRGERSESDVWTEDSGKESAGSRYSETRRGRRKRNRAETETDESSGPSKTPSLLRAKAEKLRRRASERQAILTASKNAVNNVVNNAANPMPEKPERPSYFASTWGM